MSRTLQRIIDLVERGEVRVSAHGYDELAADGIPAREAVEGVFHAQIVEAYPDFHKGPTILVLQRDSADEPIHVVWGISKGTSSPAVLVTAYRPDPEQWSSDFMKRMS